MSKITEMLYYAKELDLCPDKRREVSQGNVVIIKKILTAVGKMGRRTRRKAKDQIT